MNRVQIQSLRCVLLALCGLPVASASAQPLVFHDGFEGATIDPFWTIVNRSGIVEPSAALAHSGRQSARFVSTNESGTNKDIHLYHDFPAPIYGRVSVWVYDTGADEPSSNYQYVSLYNSVLHRLADFVVFDYDLGEHNGGSQYFRPFAPDGTQPINSHVDRTKAWHYWEIDTRPSSLTLRINGTTVYSGSQGYPFHRVELSMSGPDWRPAWTGYFDDFTLIEHCPEQLCDADFDCSGSVTGDDFDAFVLEYVAGNVTADFNADGFVSGDDFDAFVRAFSAGC